MSEFIYFANPMCSWCWGFSPCIETIKQEFSGEPIRLVLTPFRVDTTEPMDKKLRNYVLGQWQKVHATTSQPFDFNFNVPDNFIYNTTIVVKAIKAFKNQLPEKELDFMKTLQFAFYAKNQDITDQNILLELIKKFALDADQFMQNIQNTSTIDEIKHDFDLCQRLNIQSYPTFMYSKKEEYILLSSGYSPYAELKSRIVSLLKD